jgi:AcrR family transcriptional regulator
MPKSTEADTSSGTGAGASDAQAAAADSRAADSRAAGFMRSALAIIGETGRADFTVLEVVERSKTSLRAFYQHFTTKDDLLLALIGKIMSESTARWRTEAADLTARDALRRLMDRIGTPPASTTQDSINRGLTFSNDHLMGSRPRDFARVLAPLHDLIGDIVKRGIAEGDFRPDLDVDTTAAIVMQTALGALRLRSLSGELIATPVDTTDLYEFCLHGLVQ